MWLPQTPTHTCIAKEAWICNGPSAFWIFRCINTVVMKHFRGSVTYTYDLKNCACHFHSRCTHRMYIRPSVTCFSMITIYGADVVGGRSDAIFRKTRKPQTVFTQAALQKNKRLDLWLNSHIVIFCNALCVVHDLSQDWRYICTKNSKMI